MSKKINQSGQIIVADRFVSLSDPDSKNYFRVTSSISSSDKLQESIVNDFLDRYDLQIDGSTNVSYGTTLTAKVYDRDNQEYVDFPSIEFSWKDVSGKILKNAHNVLYIPADYEVEESTEKKVVCTWNHIVDYSIGTTLKNVEVEINTFAQLSVLDIVEYQWNDCLTEQELEEQGFKQLEWYTSIPANENNNLYLWSRRSTNNRISWNYYRTTGQKGEDGQTAKDIKIISTRYYFDRAEKNSSGGKGNYVANQIAVLSLRYFGIGDTEQVEWYFNGDLRYPLQIDRTINLDYTSLENKDTLDISVKYNGEIYDTIQIKTNVIKSTYAGILPSSDISPIEINGREVIDGDHFIYINSNGEPIVRLFTNGEWKDITGEDSAYYSQVMSNVLYDVMKQQEVISTENGTYNFFRQLASFSAFIENLFANYIKINGSIYGGSYNKDGVQISEEKGFYLDKNGLFKAYLAELNDVYIKSIDTNGTLIIETKKETAAGTINISCTNNMWNKSILFNYVSSEYVPCVFNGENRYISFVAAKNEESIKSISAYATAPPSSTGGGMPHQNENRYTYYATKYVEIRLSYTHDSYGSASTTGHAYLNGKQDYYGNQTLSLNPGDYLEVIVNANAMSVPNITSNASITCTIYEKITKSYIVITPTNTSLYPNNWMIYNETEYVRHSLTFSGFNSNNFFSVTAYDVLASQLSSLNKNETIYTNKQESYLTYNGSTNNVRAISVYDNYATFYFEYSVQTIVFSDIGSEFNGKLVILANPTSLLVCNLLPSARDITDIGDPNEKFNNIYVKTGYFDKLYVNGKEIT